MTAPCAALPGRFLAEENLGPYYETAIRRIATMRAAFKPKMAPCGDQVDDMADDRGLLNLCSEFIRNERRIASHSWCGSDPIADDDDRVVATEPIEASQRAMSAFICDNPPTTDAGIRAVALALVAWSPNLLTNPDGHIEGELLFALLSGLIGPIDRVMPT
jgi:hypothetical protein